MLDLESDPVLYFRVYPERAKDPDELVEAARRLYLKHGLGILQTRSLSKYGLLGRFLKVGIAQPALLARLQLAHEFATWKNAHRSYRGDVKPKWTWESAVARAGEVVAENGATLNSISAGRYREMRELKENWHRSRADFWGISYADCYSSKRLAEHLEPFIGILPSGTPNQCADVSERSLYRDKEELLEECRRIATEQPDGIFPPDSWLRKRGKYEGRPGPVYNTLSNYICRWLGSTRGVRALLGQGNHSTVKWDEAKVRAEWSAFEAKTGLTPSQAKGKNRIAELPADIVNWAGRIYRVAHEMGLLGELRGGRKLSRWSNRPGLAA